MNECNLNFTANIIYADFKQAIHSVVSNIFPEVIRKGCRFHLVQSKEIQSVGLSTVFKNKSEIMYFFSYCFV